jgi:hypothetical protein
MVRMKEFTSEQPYCRKGAELHKNGIVNLNNQIVIILIESRENTLKKFLQKSRLNEIRSPN